jgi:hypothetical protein
MPLNSAIEANSLDSGNLSDDAVCRALGEWPLTGWRGSWIAADCRALAGRLKEIVNRGGEKIWLL